MTTIPTPFVGGADRRGRSRAETSVWPEPFAPEAPVADPDAAPTPASAATPEIDDEEGWFTEEARSEPTEETAAFEGEAPSAEATAPEAEVSPVTAGLEAEAVTEEETEDDIDYPDYIFGDESPVAEPVEEVTPTGSDAEAAEPEPASEAGSWFSLGASLEAEVDRPEEGGFSGAEPFGSDVEAEGVAEEEEGDVDIGTELRRWLDDPRLRELASELEGLPPDEIIARAFAEGFRAARGGEEED